MSWTPKNFNEACLRAAGRRAYNARRRLARTVRISRILALQDFHDLTGRELAALLKVHEATISRDLRFINRVKADYRRSVGCEMTAGSFRWIEGGQGWQTTFEMRDGVRVK
jgi:predicted DNA-binding transcriptional regulator YafY